MRTRLKVFLPALLFLVIAGIVAWFWLHWIATTYEPPFSFIEDGLYLGSSVSQPPPGTRAVVNLCGREDPYKTEASLWLPIFENEKEPTLDWLREAVEFIAAQRKAARPTYVHCLAGMNRSGAVVTAYLMYEHGWSRDEALRFVQSKRDVVQPNPILMRLLSEWETELKQQRAARDA